MSDWPDGTPPRRYYHDRALDRQITELLGLAKGMICDGRITDTETVALRQWLMSNPEVMDVYPGNILAPRIVEMFEDGVLDDDEREALSDLLFDVTGEPKQLTGSMNEPARLPLDEPPPPLAFTDREYVLTGIFKHGQRAKCQREITSRAGRCGKDVTRRTDVLVIGSLVSPAWIQSTHGRKIEKAVAMKQSGHRISIVNEDHWVTSLR